MPDEEIIKRLKRFSKDQILESIANWWQGDYLLRSVLHELETNVYNDLRNQQTAAIKEKDAAWQAYIKWNTEVCEKYGNGRKLYIRDMPPQEFEKGCQLKDKWEEAQRKVEILGKKIDKILN